MTDQPSKATANAPAPKAKTLREEIGSKWGKFTTDELTKLKNNDDLVAQLVTKYGLAKDAATRDAAALVKGRAF